MKSQFIPFFPSFNSEISRRHTGHVGTIAAGFWEEEEEEEDEEEEERGEEKEAM